MDKTLTGQYTVHLICSLLKGEVPQNKPEQVTFEDIYRMAVFHNVTVMTLTAIKKTGQEMDPALKEKWERRAELASAQSVVQLHERDMIYQLFEDNRIPYLPLKGCIVKEMYPDPKYRQMADLDILVHEEDNAKVKTVLEDAGYTCKHFGQEVHDIYEKKPFMDIEIHYRLLSDVHFVTYEWTQEYMQFFVEPWQKAEHGDSYRYHFSDSDFYLYMLVHLAKHYSGSGSGIRQFLDVYYLMKNLSIDRQYVDEQLELYGLKDFCKTVEKMVLAWFGEAEADEHTTELEQDVFSSGSYGNQERSIRHEIEKFQSSQKKQNYYFHYIKKRLFPSLEVMRVSRPVLRKYPVLLPAFWLGRILTRGIITIPKQVKRLRLVRKVLKDSQTDPEKRTEE